jgi:hypothetical protein
VSLCAKNKKDRQIEKEKRNPKRKAGGKDKPFI